MQNAVDLCVANTERYFRREEDAVERMNEALILTGISMGITGYTRPRREASIIWLIIGSLPQSKRASRIRSTEIP